MVQNSRRTYTKYIGLGSAGYNANGIADFSCTELPLSPNTLQIDPLLLDRYPLRRRSYMQLTESSIMLELGYFLCRYEQPVSKYRKIRQNRVKNALEMRKSSEKSDSLRLGLV